MSRFSGGRLVAVAAGLAVAVGVPQSAAVAGVVSPSTVPPSAVVAARQDPICEVSYLLRPRASGLQAYVTITNSSGQRINGWSLTFRLPAGQTIVGARGARYSSPTGDVLARDAGYNAEVEPGGSVTIEFTLVTRGTRDVPRQFAVNGNVCAVGLAGAS